MNLNSKLDAIEEAMASWESGPLGVPQEWLTSGPQSEANERALETFELLAAMDATVPLDAGLHARE